MTDTQLLVGGFLTALPIAFFFLGRQKSTTFANKLNELSRRIQSMKRCASGIDGKTREANRLLNSLEGRINTLARRLQKKIMRLRLAVRANSRVFYVFSDTPLWERLVPLGSSRVSHFTRESLLLFVSIAIEPAKYTKLFSNCSGSSAEKDVSCEGMPGSLRKFLNHSSLARP